MLEIYDEPASEELSDYDSELENFIVVDEEEEKLQSLHLLLHQLNR